MTLRTPSETETNTGKVGKQSKDIHIYCKLELWLLLDFHNSIE